MIVKTTMTIPAPAATAAIGYIQTGTPPPPSTPGEEAVVAVEEAVVAGEETVAAGEETVAAAAECE